MIRLRASMLAFAAALGLAAPSHAASLVTVAATETIAGYNPYGDSVGLMDGVWCDIYGCWFDIDEKTLRFTSQFIDSWKVEDPLTWVFHLKPGVKRSNGEPVVPEDFVHSVDRMKHDPHSRQQYRVDDIAEVLVRDPQTVVVKTKRPFAILLEYLQEVTITSKAQWDAHGADADRVAPYGAGPYKLKELVVDDHISIEKNQGSPLLAPDNPDQVLYRIIREPQQRVTALFNGEVQIAQFLPPQLVAGVEANPATKIGWTAAFEDMFLAMSPRSKPWDNKLVREAVASAIDRDAIIKFVLQGQAVRLDGPSGPGQVGYDPDLKPKYPYDPARSRALLKEAGYPDGLAVDFYAPVGRYIADKELCEAIAAMLDKAGFKVSLKTPEWATLWNDVQKGRTPFYYMGRGTLYDPLVMLAQYFQTGTPRIGYSNPEVDALVQKAFATFDDGARVKVLQQAMDKVVEEAPAVFLWRHKWPFGISKSLDYQPSGLGEMHAADMHILAHAAN